MARPGPAVPLTKDEWSELKQLMAHMTAENSLDQNALIICKIDDGATNTEIAERSISHSRSPKNRVGVELNTALVSSNNLKKRALPCTDSQINFSLEMLCEFFLSKF